MLDALRFLTVLPLGRQEGPPQARGVAAFPLVGLLVGLVWAVVAAVVSDPRFFGVTAVAAAFVLIADALLTGGLHLDAFADVADGVASRLDRDGALTVMREPTIGAVGAAALLLVCLLRFALLITAVDFAFRLVAAPVAGRAAMALLLGRVPVREGSSLAYAFTRPGAVPLAVAVVAALLLVAFTAQAQGLAALALALVATAAYGGWWRRRFGGLTGDGVGACGFVAETVALLALAAR
jgi:adenosylcobinamide-GDP ribazoletransferase